MPATNVESKKLQASNLPKSNLWDEATAASKQQKQQQEEQSAASKSSNLVDTNAKHLEAALSAGSHFTVDAGRPAQLQQVMDALHSAKISFNERNTYDLRSLQRICDDILMPFVPALLPAELTYVTAVLSFINHQDYTLAQHLSRRACQVAASLSVSECCRMLLKLYKLKVHDSLTILVRKIEQDANNLALGDLTVVIHAAQLQSQTTASLQPLVARCLYLLAGRVGEGHLSIVQLVTCVEVAAKFGQSANPASKQILDGAGRRAGEMTERMLAATLQSAHSMNLLLNSKHLFEPLAARAVVLARTMDVRYLEPLLDVFSLLPFNSAPFVEAALTRLADDAGQLQTNHLVSVLELVASYPGAKGSTAIPALALAAAVRKDMLDQLSVTSVLLSLAQLHQFSDEFYQLFEFLLVERKGFKAGSEVVDLLGLVPSSAAAAADTRFAGFVQRAVAELISSLNQEDSVELQKQLHRLGIDDRNLTRRLAARLEALNAEAAVADRAAAEALLRRNPAAEAAARLNNGGQAGYSNSSHATAEWDMVQPQPQQTHQSQAQRPPSAPQQQQKPQQQQQQMQQPQQQRVSSARPSRPAPRPQQQQQQKKNLFKRSNWDGFIE